MSEIKQYDIRVHVKTEYLPSESDEDSSRYVFAYTITVENHGEIPAKLLSRHWIITDAENRVQEVKGKGVIGEQPHLKSGESFSYTSGTMIETPVGSMQGTYQMIADDGETFDAIIKPFTLAIPGVLHWQKNGAILKMAPGGCRHQIRMSIHKHFRPVVSRSLAT